MSVLGEPDLLGPRAHEAACGEAVLKAVVEDFQVDKVLGIPLSGEGECLWLWVGKCRLNTEEAARRSGRAAGMQQKNVGYAGLKDRQVLTRQWFNLHLSGKVNLSLGVVEGVDLRILRRICHSRKLQRGAYAANGLTLRLIGLRMERAVLDARLGRIAAGDMPSYLGLQRFGHGGGNLVDACSCAEQDLLPANRNLRSRFLSVGHSYLLNRPSAERVTEGSWNRAVAGDLLAFIDNCSFFLAGEKECRDARLAALDLHPIGPLWGEGDPSNGAGVLDRELALAGSELALCRWLAKAGMAHEWCILRLLIQGLARHYPESDVLQLEFILPAGCFATVVVREILDLVPTGQTENPCAY